MAMAMAMVKVDNAVHNHEARRITAPPNPKLTATRLRQEGLSRFNSSEDRPRGI